MSDNQFLTSANTALPLALMGAQSGYTDDRPRTLSEWRSALGQVVRSPSSLVTILLTCAITLSTYVMLTLIEQRNTETKILAEVESTARDWQLRLSLGVATLELLQKDTSDVRTIVSEIPGSESLSFARLRVEPDGDEGAIPGSSESWDSVRISAASLDPRPEKVGWSVEKFRTAPEWRERINEIVQRPVGNVSVFRSAPEQSPPFVILGAATGIRGGKGAVERTVIIVEVELGAGENPYFSLQTRPLASPRLRAGQDSGIRPEDRWREPLVNIPMSALNLSVIRFRTGLIPAQGWWGTDFLSTKLPLTAIPFIVLVGLSGISWATKLARERSSMLTVMLRGRDAQLQVIMGAYPLGVFLVDGSGNLTYSNSEFHRLFKTNEEQTLHQVWYLVCFPGERGTIAVKWNDCVRHRLPFSHETIITEGQSHPLKVELSAAPLIVEGAVVGYLGLVRDTTRNWEEHESLSRLVTELAVAREDFELGLETVKTLLDQAVQPASAQAVAERSIPQELENPPPPEKNGKPPKPVKPTTEMGKSVLPPLESPGDRATPQKSKATRRPRRRA